MRFSICIPNFNYANYLPLTFNSIRESTHSDFEVVVSDNASTDNSVAIIEQAVPSFNCLKYIVNPINYGFAPNLDKAASLATGDYLIMLSSDDLMVKDTLSIYADVIRKQPGVIISAAWDIIDSQGNWIDRNGPNANLWSAEDVDEALSKELGCTVYAIDSDILLKRSLLRMATPFNFCTVAYPRELYNSVGGYEATRLINPDKWFHWKILARSEKAVYIDKPLFQYRWHNQNQSSIQQNTGYLKFMVDEYRNTMEVTSEMLNCTGLERNDIVKAFVRYDVYRHGLGEFSKGRWLKSFRVFLFGLSTYPSTMVKNQYFLLYILALFTTPLGAWLLSKLRR